MKLLTSWESGSNSIAELLLYTRIICIMFHNAAFPCHCQPTWQPELETIRFGSWCDPILSFSFVSCNVNCNKIWLQYPTVQCDLIINRRRLIRTSCEPMRNFHAFQFKRKLLKSWIQNILMWRANVYTMLCIIRPRARLCWSARRRNPLWGNFAVVVMCIAGQTDGHLFNPPQCWFLNPEWSFRTAF